jgi:Rrf2 family protein
MLALAEHERAAANGGDGRRGGNGASAASSVAPPLSAARIATEMRIPARFVAHVLADLGRANLVVGSPGRNGGYRLALPAERIDLLRIVDAAEPAGSPARCVLRGIPCDPTGRCAVHDAFSGATSALRAELARTSLAGLVTSRT